MTLVIERRNKLSIDRSTVPDDQGKMNVTPDERNVTSMISFARLGSSWGWPFNEPRQSERPAEMIRGASQRASVR
jgi:hypothetical protein